MGGQKVAQMAACLVVRMGAHLADPKAAHLADQRVARMAACLVGQTAAHLVDLLADLREGQLEERWAVQLAAKWEGLLVDWMAAQLVEIWPGGQILVPADRLALPVAAVVE